MFPTKIGENTTNILKLLFFIKNLLFVTSNQLSTYRKLNLHLTSSVYFKVYHAFAKTCFDECFLFYVIPERHCFSRKFIVALRLFWAPCCCFLWSQCIARIRILCFITAITIWCKQCLWQSDTTYFSSSDWSTLEFLLTEVTNVL